MSRNLFVFVMLFVSISLVIQLATFSVLRDHLYALEIKPRTIVIHSSGSLVVKDCKVSVPDDSAFITIDPTTQPETKP